MVDLEVSSVDVIVRDGCESLRPLAASAVERCKTLGSCKDVKEALKGSATTIGS